MTSSGTAPLRLAMWSGPRNISTAMMRAWGNRADTAVVDEPLYAHYLHVTGRDHPGRAETLAAGPIDVGVSIERLLGPVPGGKRVFYQKHMTHHLLAGIDRGWLEAVTNCFLIRNPDEVLASLVKHVPDLTLADTGFPQQAEIFDLVCEWTGHVPPVVDAADVLRDPRRMLSLLCEAVGVTFSDRMLAWAPGLRETDGAWAKYWYKEVEHTTGFKAPRANIEPLPEHLRGVGELCRGYYSKLYGHRLGQ